MRKRIQRPSPALVVACIALFVALGGVGYAAATIGTSDIKNGAVTSKKIKNRTIVGKDIKQQTINALRGQRGASGPAGPQGPTGATGPAGTAIAYAQTSGAAYVSDRTKGFDGITRPSTGLYCLSPTPAVIAQAFLPDGDPNRPFVASIEYGNTTTQTDTLSVQVRGINAECPNNTFEVHTYRNGALSNTIAFTVVIP